jgi:hypothetical protein
MKQVSVLALACVFLASSSCSFVFVDSPHVTPAGQVECTSERTMPLVDALVGVTGIVAPFVKESLRDRQTENPNLLLDIGIWAAGLGYTISAIWGISKVKRCRRLRASMELSKPTPVIEPSGPAPVAPTAPIEPAPTPTKP